MKRTIRTFVVKLPKFLTCREFEEFIDDYLEGNLPLINQIKTYLHLLICKDCRDYIEAYRKSIQMGKAFFENRNDRVPYEMPEELVSIIANNMKKN